MPSLVSYDCGALVVLRFRYLGHNFLKPGDFEDISVSRIVHLFKVHG
jgi:hypothetical protein